jgi:hypothetical protein
MDFKLNLTNSQLSQAFSITARQYSDHAFTPLRRHIGNRQNVEEDVVVAYRQRRIL